MTTVDLAAGLCSCGTVWLIEGARTFPAEGCTHSRNGCPRQGGWCGCGLHWMTAGQPPFAERGRLHDRGGCPPHPPP